MAKQYNIRWRESDEKELRRVVKNYNAKISRLAKKDAKNAAALPEKMSVKQLKEMIDTRQDLNRELNSLKRFSEKGAEELVSVPDNKYNLVTTKWQRNEMSMRAGLINRKRKQRLEEIQQWEMKSGGQALGYKKGDFGMGKADEVALSPIKAFNPSMSRKDLNMRFRHIRRESQSNFFDKKEEFLRQNYIKGLRQTYSEDDIGDIVTAIEKMNFKDFYKRFQEEGGTMEFASRLPNNDLKEAYVEQLKSTWTPNK